MPLTDDLLTRVDSSDRPWSLHGIWLGPPRGRHPACDAPAACALGERHGKMKNLTSGSNVSCIAAYYHINSGEAQEVPPDAKTIARAS